MTREEARYYLQSSGFSEEQMDTIEQAFTCEDAISRQAAIDAIYKMHMNGKEGVLHDLKTETGSDALFAETIADVVETLEDLPSVNPQEPSNDMVSRGIFEQVMWERDVAIEQLKDLGYGLGEKPKTGLCEDAISRQAVCDYIAEFVNNEYSSQAECEMVNAMIEGIQHLPPVTPQPKTGHWIRQDNTKEPLYGWYFCSEYNSVIGDKTKFCSNCGAKMEGSNADSD